MYGIQTIDTALVPSLTFENDVKMYGIQTERTQKAQSDGLRMM